MAEISTIEIQVISQEYVTAIKNNKSKAYFFFKRLFAIVTSLLAIIILSPVLLITAFAVWISSKGPAIYKDLRIGKGGKHINVYKFLNDEQKEQWIKERKIKNDPRITKVGRFIRKTAIDELPQLFNILKGDIAIVGTRPITTKEFANYSKEEIQLLTSTRPGLTGYWQVYKQGKTAYQSGDRQKMDIEYFERRSLLFDLKLIFLTIPALIKRGGAE